MSHHPSAISHDAFNAQLMAFLEGDADDATHSAMERHAQQCAECGALLADLRGLRVEASKLPELAPSRDLWAGIAARIEAPVVPIGSALVSGAAGSQGAVTQNARHQTAVWLRGGLAAAALAAAVGLGYFTGQVRPAASLAASDSADTLPAPQPSSDADYAVLLDSMARDGSAPTGGSPSAFTPATASAQLAVATLTADYDREIARLRALVDERRNQLDPVTVAVIEKNLRVIDAAILESKRAIARDPASRFLIESLNQSLESKVELLRVAAALPNRT